MTRVKSVNHNRTKGHNYERELVKIFKELGFDRAISTRASSKLLDDCKVDINFIPYRIQAKSGYDKVRPKFEVLKSECDRLIQEKFPEDEAALLLNKPYILFHKISKSKEFVTLEKNDFIDILRRSLSK